MKTTVDIADGLLADAKAIASRNNIALREVIEEGLRAIIARERQPKPPFKLREAACGEGGLVAGLAWGEITGVLYQEDFSPGRQYQPPGPLHGCY